MRFFTSFIVIGAYLLNTVSANVEQSESVVPSKHGTASNVGSRAFRGLLNARATCGNGSGPCPNDATQCCPVGGDCCNNGRCCDPGFWCYSSFCCHNNQDGCANQGCCPRDSNCCADGSCCDSGWYCYKSDSNGGAIRCCQNGQVCT